MVGVDVLGAQAGAGGFVALHRTVKEDRLAAARLDQLGMGKMSPPNEVGERRVVGRTTDNE